MKWQDGAIYEGNFSFNKAEGKGTFYHTNGDVYVGNWYNDKASGHGTYTHINGTKCKGYWKQAFYIVNVTKFGKIELFMMACTIKIKT